MVFATDSIKFKQQFPSITNVTFIPNWIFNVGSDSIKIMDYRGFMACKAYYNNTSTWPMGANGMGYTLEKSNAIKNGITHTDWRTGCLRGSPGKAFSACTKDPLIISEINYKSNPNNNSGQWFELKNITGTPLNLNNYILRFNAADSMIINATLAPVTYLVVTNDSNLYLKEFPYTKNYLFHSYKLDTLKNTIKIYNNNILINSIYYDPSVSNLQAANGSGFTLELINDTLDQSKIQSWTTGCYKGSPGTEMLSPCKPALNSNLIISEINYLSDTFNNSGQWLEIFNNSNQAINLKYWILRTGINDFIRFNSPISISANNYLVLSNDTSKFRAIYPVVQNVSFHNFKLNNKSDSIFIHDYSETIAAKAFFNSTPSWYQGANGNGRTLESINGSKNNINLNDWKQGCILGSPGKMFSNCADKVMITEINYAPQISANDGKWIEIFIGSGLTGNINKYSLRMNGSIASFNPVKSTKPNDYIVFVSDTIAFNKYHKYISNKEYFPSLNISQGVSNLVLYDQDNKILQSIEYSSMMPWDTLANGNGYTLELVKDSTNYSQSNNWRSYCKRGSAGTETIYPCGNAFGLKSAYASDLPLIYPNPADKSLNIDYGASKPMTKNSSYAIKNLLGQTILRGILQERRSTIDISEFPAGVYFIQINNLPPLKFVKE